MSGYHQTTIRPAGLIGLCSAQLGLLLNRWNQMLLLPNSSQLMDESTLTHSLQIEARISTALSSDVQQADLLRA